MPGNLVSVGFGLGGFGFGSSGGLLSVGFGGGGVGNLIGGTSGVDLGIEDTAGDEIPVDLDAETGSDTTLAIDSKSERPRDVPIDSSIGLDFDAWRVIDSNNSELETSLGILTMGRDRTADIDRALERTADSEMTPIPSKDEMPIPFLMRDGFIDSGIGAISE